MDNCGKLLGITSGQVTDSMKNVLELRDLYLRLRDISQNKKQKEIFDILIKDEYELFQLLKNLFAGITCEELIIPNIKPLTLDNYLEGIKYAFTREQMLNESTIKLFYSTSSGVIQKVFINFSITTSLHISYINYILIANMCT